MCCMAHGELAWLFLELDTGLDHCPRIVLSCFRARTSSGDADTDFASIFTIPDKSSIGAANF